MILCIAEKPSVAKEIAGILKATTRRDGYFEGNGYCVSWTFGHLCTLLEPHEYDFGWKRWAIETLPIIPKEYNVKLIDNTGVKKQFNTLKTLISQADSIINCGDAGQEGELIQRWVLQLAGYKKEFKRLWISSLTEEAIKEGFKKLKSSNEFELLFQAGRSRAICDWIIGMNATRAYTTKVSKDGKLLSIGRVQTPTLAMIVNRYNEIINFVPKKYWELKTLFKNVLFSYEKAKFDNPEDAEQILSQITGKIFKITNVENKKGKELPPRLFDLTSLQVECNKIYGLSAENTLNTIQSLYEKKFTTYPRVDTTYLSDDIYPKIKGILSGMKAYASLTNPLLSATIKKSKKVFDNKKVTDHHAIIPTGINPSNLNDIERKVYDAVARRFIAAFYPDCIVSNTNVTGEVESFVFKANGKEIIEEGWRVVYAKADDKNDNKEDTPEDEQVLPTFKKGESGEHEPTLKEKQTQAPKQFTEATLLRAMETAGKEIDDEELRDLMKDNGIGRPSTRANIIETLFKRNYIIKEKKNIIPTETGINLIRLIEYDMLKSAELTGIWERKLREIEKGTYNATTFIKETEKMVTDIINSLKNPKPKKKVFVCPKCRKGQIIKGNTAYGCSDWKNGCDFKINMQHRDMLISEKDIVYLLQTGLSHSVFQNKETNQYYYLKINEAFEVVEEPEGIGNILCPICKTGRIIKGKAAYGCNNWKNGCKFIIKFEEYTGEEKDLGRFIRTKK